MAGIYIHIPFCKQKCSYCDFHFSTTFSDYRQRMIDAIGEELIRRKEYLQGREVETVYFGGGTPSLLNAEELEELLSAVRNNFKCSGKQEITLEANPDDITAESLEMWKSAGVNRLSIGLQSFRKKDLDWMNRAHSVEEARTCVQLARSKGFDNLTVDLIYGLPGLSNEEWRSHVQEVVDMGVPHVSAYCLTVEDKTALSNWVKKGKIVPATEDQQSEHFKILLDTLESQGYVQYEISNFSLPGYESRHNSAYWKGKWYLGAGPSAHSFNGTSRQWNIANNHAYMNALENGDEYWETEALSNEDRFNEYLLTGLRTIYGVRMNQLSAIMEIPEDFYRKIEAFTEAGWMHQKDGILLLTKSGRLKADYIASELFVLNR